eukprot:12437448-Ditylum_brightwellii.AAC.1
MQGKAGAIRYMAPEMRCNDPYDASVDVYSFDDDGKGKTDGRDKIRPDLRYIENESISSLLNNCWNHNANERWRFDAIVAELKRIVTQMHEEEESLRLEEESIGGYNNSLVCTRMTRLFQNWTGKISAIENGKAEESTDDDAEAKQNPQHIQSDDQCLGRQMQANGSPLLGIDNKRIAPKTKKIEDFYDGVHDESRELGRSAIGIVRKVTNKTTGIDYAVKIVQVEKIPMQHIRNEVLIMCEVDHPNIVRLEEVYESEKVIYIVQELCEGGDLAGLLTNPTKKVQDPQLWELRCADYMKQMLSGLQYLHSKGIVHRDLKLENILFKSKDPDSELKIIDFDLSKHFQPGERHQENVGTLYTTAPE